MSNHINLFDDTPSDLPEEVVETVLGKPDLRIERIISHGHASPAGFWYDQEQHEWVLLLQGSARLRFEDHTIEMKGMIIPPPMAHDRSRRMGPAK